MDEQQTATPDTAIAALAEVQHGVFTRSQALGAGISGRAIQGRIESRRWIPVGKHVIRVAGAPETWRQRVLASVLDAGPGAVATLRPAAALWQIPGYAEVGCDVLRLRGSNHRPSLGKAHETRSLPDRHLTVRNAIPVVTTARLIVELASREHPRRVERSVDNAIAAGTLSPQQLFSVVTELAGRGRTGSTFLRALVEQLSPGYVPPASELEARFRDVVRAAGLPEPVLQLEAGGGAWIGRVDVSYPAARLIIELDSRRWHDSRGAVDSDRRRRNDLVRAGWTVIQVTWRQLHDDPIAVVALVRALLGAASAAA